MVKEQARIFQKWLDRARHGSSAAQRELADEHRSWLTRKADRMLPPRLAGKEGASDVAQKTIVAAITHIDQFEGHNARTFRGWLAKILTNTVHAVARREKPKADLRQALPDDDSRNSWLVAEQTSASVKVDQNDRLDLLLRALAQLDDDDRRLIEMKWLDESSDARTYDDVATQLESNPAALRQRMARTLERIPLGMRLLNALDECGVDERYRTILCRRYFRRWPWNQVATEIGCDERAARRLYDMALGKLPSYWRDLL